MEFAAELADIYSEVYEFTIGKKKSANDINHIANKCIENGDSFTKIVYGKEDPEDKFAYHRTMLNLELSSGSKLTKWITPEPRERIEKTKEALNKY